MKDSFSLRLLPQGYPNPTNIDQKQISKRTRSSVENNQRKVALKIRQRTLNSPNIAAAF